MSDNKFPGNWEEDTRFDGPEHWGGDPRWKHLFPKSGTPGTFVPVEVDSMVDSTDDAGNSADDAAEIDEMESWDADRNRRGSQDGKGGRVRRKSGASRRWRQGKEMEPSSSSSRRYSEDEEDDEAWMFRELKPRPRIKCNFSALSSSEELEFDDNTAGIVGVDGIVASRGRRRVAGDRAEPRCAQSRKLEKQGKFQSEEWSSSDGIFADGGLKAARAKSRSGLDLSASPLSRSPQQGGGSATLQEIDDLFASGDDVSDSDNSGCNSLRGNNSASFNLSPSRTVQGSAEKAVKGGVIREKGGRRVAPPSKLASGSGGGYSGGAARRGGGGNSRASRSGGNKERVRAVPDKEGWIQRGAPREEAFKGSETSMRKNKNRRLKQQTLSFPVEVDD